MRDILQIASRSFDKLSKTNYELTFAAFSARSAASAVAATGVLPRSCVTDGIHDDKHKYRKHDKPCRYRTAIIRQKFKHNVLLSDLYLPGELGALLVGSGEHKDHKRQHQYRGYQSDNVYASRKQQPELIYHQRYRIREAALISYREPRPLCRVHFAADSSDSRKTRRAQQVEYEEAVTSKGGHCDEIHNAEYSDYLFLRNKTHYRSDCRRGLAKAKRCEYPADSASYLPENAVRKLKLGAEAERAVDPAERAARPDNDRGQEYDSTRLFDEAPAAFPH